MRPELMEIAAQHVFSIRELVPRDSLVGKAAALADEIRTALAVAGVDPAGPPFVRVGDLGVGTVDLEAGLPTEFTCSTAYTRMTEGILPGGPVVVFTGEAPFDQAARHRLAQWLDEQGLDDAAPPWTLLDDSGTVIWPVRTVRDAATFVGRHGPRADLSGIRRLARLEGDIGELISTVPERPLNLDSVIRSAQKLAGATCVLTPDNPQIARWLRLMARAGIASVARCAPGETLPPVDLDGSLAEIRAPRSLRHSRLSNLHTGAMQAALAVGDPVALDLLRQARLDDAASALGRAPGDRNLLQAKGLQAAARGDGSGAAALFEAALSEAAQQAARTQYPGLGSLLLAIDVPELELALAGLRSDQAGFDAALRRALVAHRQWWATGQANPGIPQDQDLQGFLALGPLCSAALRHREGQPVTIASEYLPASIARAPATDG